MEKDKNMKLTTHNVEQMARAYGNKNLSQLGKIMWD
jgi:hypothetical protein